MSDKERKKLSTKLNHQFTGIYELKDANGLAISDTFQRLPLRKLVDYYKIIKTPISLHGIGRNLKNLKYVNAQEFINDLVQMTWNAKLYNVKGSMVYKHAEIVDNYLREVINKLNNDKWMGNLFFPDLGPLPEGEVDDDTDTPPLSSGGQHGQGVAQQHLQSQGFGGYNQYTGMDASSAYPAGNSGVGNAHSASPSQLHQPTSAPAASGIRRGRPPIIDKPYETRIKLILKQFKKLRLPNDPNYQLTTNFERLPDPKYNSPFYSVIKTPISLFEIRTKVRTRKYHNVDEFIADITLMFENSKYFYSNAAPGTQGHNIYQEALVFEQEATKIIHQELLRSEKELLTANTPGGDGIIRFPLDSIEIEGYTYHIGDWVLIKNDNDPQRPTVGQIFRLWSTEDGTKYTNVCWYYRPEQTCHRVDRLFFTNEVCKTGQYRDHIASEIVGPCYVIFLTRYQKGDLPEGVIPPGCPWFICEFRYNENSHVFNRIRTWKACLPDEIRDKLEQPLIPLHEPRKLIKFDSPIKNMLPQGVDAHMQILDAQQGSHPNTPPIVGSVYLRANSEDDELGQYINSPNVVRQGDNDTPIRQAYLFTPPLQMKMSGSTFPSLHSTAVTTATMVGNAGGISGLGAANAVVPSPPSKYTGASLNLSYLQPNPSFGVPPSSTTPLVGTGMSPVASIGFAPVGGSIDDRRLNSIPSATASPANMTGDFKSTGFAKTAPPSLYAASVNIYRQQLQQQQQHQQQQQYQQTRYNSTVGMRLDGLQSNNSHNTLGNDRSITPTGANGTSIQNNTYSSSSTSKYSTPLIGGILSYTTVDENNQIIRVTEGINHKKRKIEIKRPLVLPSVRAEEESDGYIETDDEDLANPRPEESDEDDDDDIDDLVDQSGIAGIASGPSSNFVTDIIWYRTPPSVIPNRIITSDGLELGHSAKYLAWKAQQEAS